MCMGGCVAHVRARSSPMTCLWLCKFVRPFGRLEGCRPVAQPKSHLPLLLGRERAWRLRNGQGYHYYT
jgi:hypothetical protein